MEKKKVYITGPLNSNWLLRNLKDYEAWRIKGIDGNIPIYQVWWSVGPNEENEHCIDYHLIDQADEFLFLGMKDYKPDLFDYDFLKEILYIMMTRKDILLENKFHGNKILEALNEVISVVQERKSIDTSND
jgi:hypothetical protein